MYKTNTDLYLTFLTHNDSYMEKVPAGSILTVVNGDLCYNGKISIDDQAGYLYHGWIEKWNANPTGDGTGLENRRASDPSL